LFKSSIILFVLAVLSYNCFSQQLKESILYASSNNNDLIIKSIITDNISNRYLYGSFDQSMKLGKKTYTSYGMYDLFVIKTDSDNNIIWVNTIGSYTGQFGA